MKKSAWLVLCFVLLCLLIPLGAFATDINITITPQKDMIDMNVGKSANIRLTISPRAARLKGVTYESENEEIATVNASGRVIGVAAGSCNIVITSKLDETVQIKLPVSVLVPTKKMFITADDKTVRVGETLALRTAFEPENTSVQEATYKSSNARIATVDEAGVVTGVKAGKVSIVATAKDGSKVRAKINLTIVQPITGVSYKTPHVRVGVGSYGKFTATLEPKNATNKNMTWTSSDPGIATVSGAKNTVRIRGIKWGQCTITGITEDGGYQVQFVANIGSLRRAVKSTLIKIRDGKPYLAFRNASNMNITQLRYIIKGYDANGELITMSRKQDSLSGTYDIPLEPGESTQHGMFDFVQKIPYEGLHRFELAITGWSSDTGYYNDQGALCYDFTISKKNYEWLSSD